jgi:2-iminoacetate synthase ThiH
MMPANREISLTQETVLYHWDNVPEVKYNNWLRLRGEQNIFDTENFTAQGYPWMLQIEPTNMCNLSCPFCPSGRKEDPE